MSILITKDTKVITQGITGKTGQFHTRMGKEYANGPKCYVAGVTPKKGGQTFEGIPIFETVKEAKQRLARPFPSSMFPRRMQRQRSKKQSMPSSIS